MKSLITKVLLVVLVMSLSGCLFSPKDEKQSFIDAFTESACTVFSPETEDVFSDTLNVEVEKIFSKHGFEDAQAFKDAMEKYRADQDVKATILANMDECAPGEFGELILEELTE